jgi:hypothetical protein
MNEWEEGMLENNSYWDIDILTEQRKKSRRELKTLNRTFWSRIWNWRKIRKIKQKIDDLYYVT